MIDRPRLALLLACASGCGSNPTSNGPPPNGTPAEARWAVASALGPTGSLINFAAATGTVYVVSGTAELIGYAAEDGRVLWKRGDVPTRMPLAVDDSMIVALAAGPSVALRAADGSVLWRTTVPGEAVSTMPIQVGPSALTTNSAGDVFAVRLATGDVRSVGTMATLAGGPGQVWSFVRVGGDTALVVTQRETEQGRGVIGAARVVVSSGELLGRVALPFASTEFLTTQAPYVRDSLLILPVTGRIIAMDHRSGRRVWTVVNNSASIALRDGEIVSGSGTGSLMVIEAATGRVLRRFDIGDAVGGGISDQYPCREGIYFASGGLWVIQNVAGARPRKLSSDLYYLLFPGAGTLYASAPTREIAVRCT